MNSSFTHRLARREDIPALNLLMAAAIRELLSDFLSPEAVEASFDVMGLDTRFSGREKTRRNFEFVEQSENFRDFFDSARSEASKKRTKRVRVKTPNSFLTACFAGMTNWASQNQHASRLFLVRAKRRSSPGAA